MEEATHDGRKEMDLLAARLRSCERRLRRFVDHAADGFFLSVRGGAFVDVNAAACSSLGYTREELLELGVTDIQEGVDEDALDRLWDTIVPGEPITVATDSRRKDGSRFPVEVRLGRFDSEGEQLMLALVRDVTPRKQAEAELTRRAEQQKAVADLGRRALATSDTPALMEEAVRTLCAALAVDSAGVLELQPDRQTLLLRAGQGWTDGAVGHAAVPIGDSGAALTLESDEPVRVDRSALLHQQGGASGLSCAIQDRAGPFGMLWVHTMALREFTREDLDFIQAVANVLGAAVSREREERLRTHLERSRRADAVGELAGGVAHEFNNLLAVIVNYTQFALEQAERQPELRADLEEIDMAAQRASELTRELLSLSRQEPLETRRVDLNDVIRDGEAMLRRVIGDQVELVSDLGAELWKISAGAGQLEQILVQLALNAGEAMPGGGRLAISTENLAFEDGAHTDHEVPPGLFVRLTVADTGTGMSEEVAAHAFDLFFSTKPAGEGGGLGLATVHGVARQLGGFVRLYSEPGVGTALKVYLPAAEPGDAAAAATSRGVADGRGEKILLVDNEAAVRRLTGRILSEHGYDVITADGANAALAAWQERGTEIDLLLTDVVMPGMSGAALAGRLREEQPGLPLLFMSGYTAGVFDREGTQAGAVVVEKPFSSQGLLRGVREALAGAS